MRFDDRDWALGIDPRLRTAKARTTEAINQALTQIINHQISSDDAIGWFEHCGLFI
ncbi:MAG: hypothetical protein RLZZ171_1448 [Cyanobacteriota bacterium]|jgi:hypothetical protein